MLTKTLLILSDLYRNEEDYEAIIELLTYVDEEDWILHSCGI